MVYYKPIQTKITAPALAKIILNVIVWHHGLPDSIVSNRGSIFTSKFWSSLCYFLSIKRRLFTAFYPQTNSQTKWQNSTMEAYLRAFVHYEQDNWARLLLIAKFIYNNAKYTSRDTCLLSSTADTTYAFSTKRTLTPVLSPK